MKKIFLGFGFGAIQAGLFLYEAHRSGNFDRLVAVEVMPDTVRAIRNAGGRYSLNIAGQDSIERHEIDNLTILNPLEPGGKKKIISFIAEADEISTALPSVSFFTSGNISSVASLLAAGFAHPDRDRNKQTIVYAAENHNHAAEILQKAVEDALDDKRAIANVRFLNTVIGKMSGVVTDPVQIADQSLAFIAPDLTRCFLVEEFNRILISRINLPGFDRGIEVFEEKDDLLPFEFAKLYGHNATHALFGYLAARRGYAYMDQIRADRDLFEFGRAAFLEESGKSLIRKYSGLDLLFTESGYIAYVEDLLERMMNPHLRDAVERVIRDPLRKLGWDDRLIGVMRLALAQGIKPVRFAKGAAAAVALLQAEDPAAWARIEEGWKKSGASPKRSLEIKSLIAQNSTVH